MYEAAGDGDRGAVVAFGVGPLPDHADPHEECNAEEDCDGGGDCGGSDQCTDGDDWGVTV